MSVIPLLLLPALLASGQQRPEFGPIENIRKDRLQAHLEFVAHDLLEGRDTPSRGLAIAAQYIVAQMKLAGLKPGGDNGTFLQKVALRRPVVDRTATNLSIGGQALEAGKEFGAQPTAGGDLNGKLVFVDSGWVAPEWNVDSYRGVDVRGKIAVVVGQIPRGRTFRELQGITERGGELPGQALAKRGAIGMIYILKPGRTVSIADQPGGYGMVRDAGAKQVPNLALTFEAAKKVLGNDPGWEKIAGAVVQDDGAAVPSFETGVSATGKLTVNENLDAFHNVVAIAEGSDPVLKNEYVALGCHYDHVGTRRTGEDRIFNGADDNGSGTVGLIEIAHALGVGPRPKRSMILVFHGAEEKGLWGSDYFTTNPTVPLKSIIAQLNMDMIGRTATPGRTYRTVMADANGIHVIGESRLSKEFGEIVHNTNRRLYNLKYEKSHDIDNDPESLYSRSDHYNYARFGIPVAFWFDGIHEDYHQVSDSAEKIDYNKIEKVSRTVLATAYALGNRNARPKMN